MKKAILYFFVTMLFITLVLQVSFFSSKTFSKSNTNYKPITELSSQEYENTYVRVLINGQWWMYVYGGSGGTVLIDRYKIEE